MIHSRFCFESQLFKTCLKTRGEDGAGGGEGGERHSDTRFRSCSKERGGWVRGKLGPQRVTSARVRALANSLESRVVSSRKIRVTFEGVIFK